MMWCWSVRITSRQDAHDGRSDHPLMKPARELEHTDEFYQFPTYAPYSREKQHVLLSIDVERSDRATAGVSARSAPGPIRITAWRG
jgi:hypothetical protein